MAECRGVPPARDGRFRNFVPLAVVGMLLSSSPLQATLSTSGQWSIDPTVWGGGATHMVLLRGTNDSTWVLHWHGSQEARVRLYTNGQDLLVPGHRVPASGGEFFCAGHTTLGDGRALAIGGTFFGATGSTAAATFDATASHAAAPWGWTVQDTMKYGRWYPTATVLGNGTVLATSGARLTHMVTFGGTLPSEALTNEVRPLELTPWPLWNNRPAEPPPAAREGHAAVFKGVRVMFVFGGRGADGPRNDVWFLKHEPVTAGTRWEWIPVTVQPDPEDGAPAPRARHTMIDDPANNCFVIYGGISETVGGTTVFADAWRLRLPTPADNNYRWEKLSPSGAGPGPRYGHTAVYDAGHALANPRRLRMLLFGGRTTGGALAEGAVYRLDLPAGGDVNSPTWSIAATGGPASREGHVAVLDVPRPLQGAWRRQMIVYGGQGATSVLDDVWVLSRTDEQFIDSPYTWFSVSPGAGAGPRTRHAAIFHGERADQMLVFGGDTNGDPVPGGRVNDTWTLDLNLTMAGPHPSWVPVWSDSAPAARSGHTAVHFAFHEQATVPERFSVGTGTPPGDWAQLDHARRVQSLYPLMLLLGNGKLFEAGSFYDNATHVLDLQAGWQQQYPSGFTAGSAVMYRPDSVLKCGATNHGPASEKSETVALNVPSPAWIATSLIAPMLHRNDHNLTILPDGQVLVTGGELAPNVYQRRPQLWNPVTRQWSPELTLALEPHPRAYHSTAMLLPDGRVLSAQQSMNTAGDPTQRATIYSPPYLFDGDNPAVRPQIAGVTNLLRYDLDFSLCSPDAASIRSVCLIRPGAPTHGFNQSQRYVPLVFSYCGTGQMLQVVAPLNGNAAPPGDYLLFVVNVAGVPSIARWVRLGDQSGSQASCPTCSGGGCPFMDSYAADGWSVENSVLGRSLLGQLATDCYRLKRPLVTVDGRYRVRMRENEQEYTTLDGARLAIVDHDPGTQAFAIGQQVILGARVPANRVTRSGADITELVDGTTESYFVGQPGDTVMVELTPNGALGAFAGAATNGGSDDPFTLDGDPKEEPQGPQMRAERADPMRVTDAMILSSTGILVQINDGGGSWRTIAHHYPREYRDEALIDSVGAGPVRLVFVGRHRLRFVGRVLRSTTVSPQVLQLLAAQHSQSGDVRDVVAGEDGATTTLAPGDTLTLEYTARTLERGQVREWFFLSRGIYTSDRPQSRQERVEAGARFRLAQNQPNPFIRSTTIHFELPAPIGVKVEIFDLQGRSVRVLAEGRYAAGHHSIEWDRRDPRGRELSPGVYVYRLTAGIQMTQRKMVLLP